MEDSGTECTGSRVWGLVGRTSVGGKSPAGTALGPQPGPGLSLPEAGQADPAGKSTESYEAAPEYDGLSWGLYVGKD